ncbi:MAG: ATP-grasp domain-containing protein [Promethearchaeota archaeon]
MSENRIFIFEFVSGGGFNQVEIPSSLFCEGYSMLRTIIADFKAMDFEITTLLDERINFLIPYLEADSLQCIKNDDNYITIFKKVLRDCDYAFIIAPEFTDILYDLTKIVQEEKKKLLSICLKGIELGSSKIKTYDFFRKINIKTPKTYQIPLKNGLDVDFITQKLKEFKSPIVIKPFDGVGAESIYHFEKKNQIYNFFNDSKANNIDLNRKFIVQEYIKGEDLSVSLVGIPFKTKQAYIPPKILSINYQDINIKNSRGDSEYFGGSTPIENYTHMIKNIIKVLETLDLSMFNSFFGIDFIKNQNSLAFIEINPRLTTSYIGIRNILKINPVELLFNNYSNSMDYMNYEFQHHSIFKRSELEYMGDKTINEIIDQIVPKLLIDIPEFITPPISFKKSNKSNKIHFSSFIATKEKDSNSSRKRLAKINDILKKKFEFRVIK